MILTFDILNTMFSHNIIMFNMFPFIFIYNTNDTGEYFQNNNEQFNDIELIQIAKIENKKFYPKFCKYNLSDFTLCPKTGCILLDEPTNLDIYLKKNHLCKYISNHESFINNINNYLNIKLENCEIVELFKNINNIYSIQYNIKLTKVSVILAVYNGQSTVDLAIKSIINQTYTNIELIIVDDKSTDNTTNIIDKYSKISRIEIKIIKLKSNRGVYFARNIGLRESTGEFITFQDSDDVSRPSRIKTQLDFYLSRKVCVVFSNITSLTNIDDNNELIDQSKCNIGMVTAFYHRKLLDLNGYYDESSRHSADLEYIDRLYFNLYKKYRNGDLWMWLNRNLSYKNVFYQIPIILYVTKPRTKNNITSQYPKNVRNQYLNNSKKKFNFLQLN
jgi:hypothetical protein